MILRWSIKEYVMYIIKYDQVALLAYDSRLECLAALIKLTRQNPEYKWSMERST